MIMKETYLEILRIVEACYELSVAQLKDRVRPCWIRPYYEIGE